MRIISKNGFLAILISLLYALLIFIIPWERIKGVAFRDREVYFEYAYYGTNVLDYKNFDSFISYISNEWLWHFMIKSISSNYYAFFNAITLLTLFIMSLFLIRKIGFFSPLILLNPLVIDLVFSQYRISLAICFLFLGLYYKRNLSGIFFIIVSFLIHTSSIIFFILYIFCINLDRISISDKNKVILLSFSGFLLSIFLSGLALDVLSAIGDRRSGYNMDRVSNSISYLSFWILNFLFLIYSCFSFGIKNIEQKISIIILAFISMNSIIGGYSSRFLAVYLPIIWVSNFYLKSNIRLVNFNIYLIYIVIQWYYWFGFNS